MRHSSLPNARVTQRGIMVDKSQVQLTTEQERDLVRRIKQGDKEAQDILLLSSVPKVRFLVKESTRNGKFRNVSHDDLFQVGFQAMYGACRSINDDMPAGFWGYAYSWVKHAILHELIAHDRTVKIPARLRSKKDFVAKKMLSLPDTTSHSHPVDNTDPAHVFMQKSKYEQVSDFLSLKEGKHELALTSQEQEFLRLRLTLTKKAIGRILKVPMSTVVGIERTAFGKVAAYFRQTGFSPSP